MKRLFLPLLPVLTAHGIFENTWIGKAGSSIFYQPFKKQFS